MTTEIKSTQTARIRALNDELRNNFSQGHAVMTTGRSARKQWRASSRLSKSMTTFAMRTIHTKSMTLARSKPRATRSFSRSIITIPH